jgi:hypothetical protein
MVSGLAVLDLHDIYGLEMNLSMSWSDPKKRPLVRAVVGFVCCNPIAIDELPVDLSVKVRERGSNIGVEPSHSCFVRSRVRLLCVIDEIVREEFIENIEPSLPLDLFGISADDGFGLLR